MLIVLYIVQNESKSYEDPYKGHQKSLRNLLKEYDDKGLKRYFKYTPAELIKKINDAFDSCKHEVPEDSLFISLNTIKRC